VARFAARAGIPAEKVHGVRAAARGGRLTTKLTQKTWGQGKADVILRRAGRAPRLAAGDSNSDTQMLELSQGESLVVDRGTEPLGSKARGRGWILQPRFRTE
jgi:phosphoserine phosphatase